MPNQISYVSFVIEQLSPLGEITARRMFGGHCLYCNGTVFALIANNILYLKTDKVNRPEFEKRKLELFHPFEDAKVSMSYCASPAEIFEDSDAMTNWVGGAVEASLRSKKKTVNRS